MRPRTPARRARKPKGQLQSPGWNDRARRELERLITGGSGQGLPVVFDFDNTLVCGDIGEATLAMLARDRVITPGRAPDHVSPPLVTTRGHRVILKKCADVTEYYEAFLTPTIHAEHDPWPLGNGYVWAVQVMEGLRLTDVLKATRRAFEWRDDKHPGQLVVTPGQTAYPVPFFYPEMLELLVELLRHKFEIWIVSASNVWSVRWMVLHALNPLLQQHGARHGLSPQRVVGVSTLLRDRKGRLHKDVVLVREQEAYAQLHPAALREFRLTSQLQFPVSTYSGKVAAILDLIGRNPYLAAGDSPGDLPMMSISRHRLWIARLNKSRYQKAMREFMERTGHPRWIIQETDARPGGSFIPEARQVSLV